MKILLINGELHHKNKDAIIMYKNIEFVIIHSIHDINHIDLTQYDAVYSPSEPIPISNFPKTKFLFGPHFSILPDNKLIQIKGNNAAYTLLSDWVIKLWNNWDICKNVNLVSLPFGVNTTKFCPTQKENRNEVFIYFKNRNPELLKIVEQILSKYTNYVIFNYSTKYNESDYLNYLSKSKYGIWIGRHESQGFALEECLSMDVPLLVWDVKSMNEEYGWHYENYAATAIPYWDDRCGEVFYQGQRSFEETLKLFLSKLDNYKPREYILENLSIDVCEQKMIDTINNIKI